MSRTSKDPHKPTPSVNFDMDTFKEVVQEVVKTAKAKSSPQPSTDYKVYDDDNDVFVTCTL